MAEFRENFFSTTELVELRM